jgi:hypothetical protein
MNQPTHPLIALNPQRPTAPIMPTPIRHSLYLAQALRNLRDNAMQPQTTPDIRTPGALASNLMAAALRRYAQTRPQPAPMPLAQGLGPAPGAPAPPAGPQAAPPPVGPPVASPLQIANGPNPSLPSQPPAPDMNAPPDPGAAAAPFDPQADDLARRGYRPMGAPWGR